MVNQMVGDDLWFNSVNLNTNAGYLDNFNIIDAATNTLNISGWHATDQSAGKDHHFIILYMMPPRTGELGRYELIPAIPVMMLPGLHMFTMLVNLDLTFK